jgi:hypothetical protein
MYPTAPKLIAAMVFGFVAWFTAGLIIPHLLAVKPGAQLGWFGEVCAVVGLGCGWIMSGRNAGRGYYAGLGFGLTTVALIVFWGLFIFSGEEALDRAIAVRYDGPIQAISDMIKLMIENLRIMAKPDVIVWLLVGALAGGILTEMSAKKWT